MKLIVYLMVLLLALNSVFAVSEFSISGFSEWDSSTISSFNANITGYPYLIPYTAAEYLFEWNTDDSVGSNNGDLNGYTLNNGTISGATTGVSGVYGEGVSFDGVDDRIQIPSGVLNESHGTIELWFKIPLNYLPATNEFAFGHYNAGNRIYIFNDAGDSSMHLQIGSGADFFIGTSLNDGEYHHIAMTWNGTYFCGYIDGIFDECKAYTGLTSVSTSYIGDNPVTVGAEWNGSLDEVRVYTEVLTPTQINESMNSHFPVETPILSYSFEAYNATHVFDTNWNVQGQDEAETGAISFDKSNYLDIDGVKPFVSKAVNYTISLWLKPNDYTEAQQTAFAATTSSTDRMAIYLNSNILRVGHYTGTWSSKSTTLTNNNWIHVVLSWNGSTTAYVNGIAITGTTTGSTTTTVGATLGAQNDGTLGWNGSLSEVQIYNRALTADEVKYLYDGSVANYEYSTSDGQLETQIPNNSPNTYNISVQATDYFPQSFEQNLGLNLSVYFNQSEISFDSFEKFTNNSLNATYWLYNKTTSSAEPFTVSLGTSGADTGKTGMKITALADNIYVENVTFSGSVTATRAYLLDSSLNVIENVSISSSAASFTTRTLFSTGDIFYIAADKSGASYTSRYTTSPSFPETNTLTEYTYGLQGVSAINRGYNVINMTVRQLTDITEAETINLPAGTNYQAIAAVPDYYNKTFSFDVAALDIKTENVTDLYDAIKTFIPRNILTNASINGNISITYGTDTETIEGTNATFNLVSSLIFLLSITSNNYNTYNENVSIPAGESSSYKYLYDFNSLWVQAYNTTDGSSITNFSVVVQNEDNYYAASTTDGTAELSSILSGVYTVTVSATGFQPNQYVVTINDDSFQQLEAYLDEDELELIFVIKDKSTSKVIEDALVVMSSYVNGSLVVVNSEYSDVTGTVAFNYIAGKKYYFAVSKSGYTTKEFSITPVYDTYTILLVPTTSYNPSVVFDDVYIQKLGWVLVQDDLSWFALRFQSSTGQLDEYSLSIAWDGGSHSETGSNPFGSTLNASFNISMLAAGSVLNVTYGYKSTVNEGWVYYSEALPVFFYQYQNTLKDDSSFFDGYGSLEKGIIGSILLIFFAAVFSLAGGSKYALQIGSLGGILGAGLATYLQLFTVPIFVVIAFVLGMVMLSKIGGEFT